MKLNISLDLSLTWDAEFEIGGIHIDIFLMKETIMKNAMLNGAEVGDQGFVIFTSWRPTPNDASILTK